MPTLARGQENTPSILNWFISINGVLTDAYEVGYQIYDITGGLPGTQRAEPGLLQRPVADNFPVAPADIRACLPGPHRWLGRRGTRSRTAAGGLLAEDQSAAVPRRTDARRRAPMQH